MSVISVGIDVSKKSLDIAVSTDGLDEQRFTIDNTPSGHQKLVARITRYRQQVRVCLEATGVYGLDIALALYRATSVSVMVVNPRRARRFAEALGVRAKTDPIDAHCLLQFCIRMDFEPWQPPAEVAFKLRALTRRMHTLIEQLVQEKNRLHAASATNELRVIRTDIKRSITFLEKSTQRLEQAAVKLIRKHQPLDDDFQRLCSVPGIAQRSAVKLLGELATMAEGLTTKQVTAFAGLDPRTMQSGSSVNAKSRISKRGNTYLRAALYMPAHNAVQRDPELQAFRDRLLERGKTKMQAKVAVMRKLLTVIHAMRRDHAHFYSEKLRAAA